MKKVYHYAQVGPARF